MPSFLWAEKARKNGHPPRRARRPLGRDGPRNRHVSQKSRKVLSKRILAWLRACFDSCASSEPGCTPRGGKRAEFRTPSQTCEKAPRTRRPPKPTCFPKKPKRTRPSPLYAPLWACFKPRAASDGQIHFFWRRRPPESSLRAKKIRPGYGRMKWAKKSPQRPTFPPTGSIIGDGELNFRVRNGIGWILPSMATGKINKLNQEKGPGIGNDNKAKPHDLLVLLG